MSDNDLLRRALQRGGCRLCMAPDTECVPIFATAAADKEPLSSKILACVSIKVHQGDQLSGRVCHACISYLNSWQSFKNRCYAAQKKQRGLLDLYLAKERSKTKVQHQQQQQHQQQHQQHQQLTTNNMQRQRQLEHQRAQLQQQRILKNALSQPSSANSSSQFNQNSEIDVSFIKEEPDDMEMEDEEADMDPTQFLARDNDDNGNAAQANFMHQGPPILTSLGLTHINHVNPYSFLSTELGHDTSQASANTTGGGGEDSSIAGDLDDDEAMLSHSLFGYRSSQSQPQCTICNMRFSNRANARRHERNIHGKIPASMLLNPRNKFSITAPMQPPQIRGARMPKIYQSKVLPKIVFDYSKPELYRELLTESKLYFIKRHIDFLEQYQNMHCNCCNRDFPTYKFFMAHMRKKYDTLSRNLCFKCLKQFETKSMFIAHLKKKNCINLYKVYCADDTISKEPLPPSAGGSRTGTKEIIANKVYGCKLCSKTFRLKVDFRGHVIEKHADGQKNPSSGAACAFCQAEFEDPVLRRRHYNNMECIVFLICGTCEEKFDTLALYIEHVYSAHLQPQQGIKTEPGLALSPPSPSPASADLSTSSYSISWDDMNSSGEYDPATTRFRNPQQCKVCGKKYNNYYNVLRHMESKHPDQMPATYRCEQCKVGYPRQCELRDHMFKIHGVVVPKIKRELLACRMCGAMFDHREIWLDHQSSIHAMFYCHLCDFEVEKRDAFEVHLTEHAKHKAHKCTLCQHSFNSERGLETHLAVMHYMKKEQMPKEGSSIKGTDDEDGGKHTTTADDGEVIDDDEGRIHDDDDDGEQLEVSVDVHINGDDDEDDDDNDDNNDRDYRPPSKKNNGEVKEKLNETDGNMADLDESIESAAKKIKLDMARMSMTPKSSDAVLGLTGIRGCPFCHETFSGGIAFANHMRSHGIPSIRAPKPNRPILPKPLAPSPMNRPGGLNKSVTISRMRCRVCQKRIHTKASYKRHMFNVHGVRDCVFIRCTLCPAEFSNDKGLKVHMFRTHNITVQQMQQDERLRPIPKQESTSTAGPSAAASAKPVTVVAGGATISPVVGGKAKIQSKFMFECDICHTVYRSGEQLKVHRSGVHGVGTVDTTAHIKNEPALSDAEDIIEPILPVPEAWWQCRYCNDTFNSSKKLTIHMNNHEGRDNSDHTCSDCGNVYATRKSLWVHRHKKHPRVPNPSTCELCNKVFFDKTELFYHLKTHSNDDVFSHLSEMQSQLAEEQEAIQQQQQGKFGAVAGATEAEVLACHICGQNFHDKRVLSKHLRLHEAEGASKMFEDNPLAALLADQLGVDENGSEYNYPSYQGQMVDGEYACDMCPKTFAMINALKVHRGWHFRSPDGRQVTDPANMWQPDSGGGGSDAQRNQHMMFPKKRSRTGNPPVCPYCNSTFASGNNLRRHIVEVHKRNEAKMMRENGTVSDSVYVEKEMECHTCDITFNSRPEWVEHKISHARTMKPSTTFEWGCEICGKVFTRKERLLAHMVSHVSKDEPSSTSNAASNDQASGGDSRSSMSSQSQSHQSHDSVAMQLQQQQVKAIKQRQLQQQRLLQQQQQQQKPAEHPGAADSDRTGYNENDEEDDEEDEADEEDEEQEEEGDEVDEDEDQEVEEDEQNDGEEQEEDEEEEEEEEENLNQNQNDDNDQNDADDQDNNSKQRASYSCDLCQVFFKTAKELRRHVTSHIINAPELSIGAVTNAAPKLDGFKCRLCGSSSASHLGMIQCMESHKIPTSLRCGQCQLYFNDAKQVIDHEMLCHPKSYST